MGQFREKLIRDRYAERIPASDIRTETDPSVIERLLMEKLTEETDELRGSGFSSEEEYADVIEVLLEIGRRHGVGQTAIMDALVRKRATKGGFSTGLVLTKPLPA